ncbi:hypothetical protein [Sorangium cellulosum]|nr:hypothetical protein [Sorangium cellulosum]
MRAAPARGEGAQVLAASGEQLPVWAERVLVAGTLDELIVG